MKRTNQSTFLTVVATMLMLAGFPASAQESSNDVLAGPKVEEDASRPGQGGMIAPQGADRRRANDLPYEQWLKAIRELSLNAQQQDAVRAIAQEYQKAQQNYRRSLGQAEQDALRQARQSREAGEQPPRETRELIQKIEANRPKPISYQERIWEVLTPAQQDEMKTSIAQLREQAAERRQRRQGRNASETATDQMNGGERGGSEMTADGAPMTQDQMNGSDESNRRARQGDARRRGSGQLDEIGRKRLNFLHRHQSKSVQRPGRDPLPEERRFEFQEE